jgi:hypothetical protein
VRLPHRAVKPPISPSTHAARTQQLHGRLKDDMLPPTAPNASADRFSAHANREDSKECLALPV